MEAQLRLVQVPVVQLVLRLDEVKELVDDMEWLILKYGDAPEEDGGCAPETVKIYEGLKELIINAVPTTEGESNGDSE